VRNQIPVLLAAPQTSIFPARHFADSYEVFMNSPDEANQEVSGWSKEASALAAQARVLSGDKLEQLVVRLQRQTGRSHQDCWRFVIQNGIRGGRLGSRRWTSEEIEMAREGLVKHTVPEIAQKLKRSTRSVRSMLQRNSLRVREIRCDLFSAESLAAALHVPRREVLTWIERGWLQATVSRHRRFNAYRITPEALALAYRNHLADLLKRGIPNQRLFEAYVHYLHSSKPIMPSTQSREPSGSSGTDDFSQGPSARV
jgi:hypothetical protein